MVFIHCTGGPDITLAAHNPASRRASAAQVTLTDAVTPMPVVSSYAFPCPCQSLHRHAMRLHDSVYRFCWLRALLPHCLKPHCYHIAPSFAKYVCMTVLCGVTTPTVLCIYYIYSYYIYIYILFVYIFTREQWSRPKKKCTPECGRDLPE